MLLFWKIYWKLSGWKFSGRFPHEIKKMIIIVAPHTSWRDIFAGFAARSILRMKNARFLGKKELFTGPFGWLFRWLGGTPVDRFSSHGAVEQVVEMFKENDHFLLAIAPEGTRKKVDKLKTGFYYIAKKANVPILMVGLDFSKKKMIFSEPFFATDDEAKDFDHILSFFAPIKGKHPELGLEHLVK